MLLVNLLIPLRFFGLFIVFNAPVLVGLLQFRHHLLIGLFLYPQLFLIVPYQFLEG